MSERIKKKDLKKPDQLQSTAQRFTEYAREHRSRIIAGAAAALLVIVLSSSWYAYGYFSERKAQELFGQAMITAISAGDNKVAAAAALEKYRAVASQYSRTDAASLSRYSMGVLYYKLNDIDNAIKSYEEFLGRASQNELKALALNGLGYCFEAKGDYAAAYKNFELAAGNPDGAAFRGSAWLNAGRMAEQLNNRQNAVAAYKKALESKNDPVAESFLKRKVSELE